MLNVPHMFFFLQIPPIENIMILYDPYFQTIIFNLILFGV